MANAEHLRILKQGANVWNLWRLNNPKVIPNLRFPGVKGPHFNNARLRAVDLSQVHLSEIYLMRADLYRSILVRADLSWAHLSEASLVEANLNQANLRGANLCRTDLRWANLSEAELIEAQLKGANLRGANLQKADFREANLQGANLSLANLSQANLNQANLEGADLTGANLSNAHLKRTDMSKAKIGNTILANIDLSDVKGIKIVEHYGPSEIGTSTLLKSQGNIPKEFLRGCGLSEWQIELTKLNRLDLSAEALTDVLYKIHELRGESSIRYYSCFISYSSKDHPITERLYNDLQNQGIRTWYAPEDMKIGDKIFPRIDEAIKIHDKLLLVLSKFSVSSQWVEREIEQALDLEFERGEIVLFPIRLDDTVMHSTVWWVENIRRSRHIGNFSRWSDHEAYQQAFERLLKDLKATR